jgi:ABC-2 type transport system permease protein
MKGANDYGGIQLILAQCKMALSKFGNNHDDFNTAIILLLLFSTMFGGNGINEEGNVSYTAFVLPGILVMVVLTSAGMSGIANYSLKTGGSFYRIYISPVKRTSIILAHILDAAVLSFTEVFVLVAISFLMKVSIASGFLALCLLCFCCS